jgi:chemotaxis signal transduction protein
MINILVFKIMGACFGIETMYVKVVTKNLKRVNSEHYPDFADGVLEYNVRKVFVINMEKMFFHKANMSLRDSKEYENQIPPFLKEGQWKFPFSGEKIKKCQEVDFIVVSFKVGEFVMPIDEMLDTFQVSEKDILSIPAFAVRHMSKDFFKGVFAIGDKLVLILDVSKLLN